MYMDFYGAKSTRNKEERQPRHYFARRQGVTRTLQGSRLLGQATLIDKLCIKSVLLRTGSQRRASPDKTGNCIKCLSSSKSELHGQAGGVYTEANSIRDRLLCIRLNLTF